MFFNAPCLISTTQQKRSDYIQKRTAAVLAAKRKMHTFNLADIKLDIKSASGSKHLGLAAAVYIRYLYNTPCPPPVPCIYIVFAYSTLHHRTPKFFHEAAAHRTETSSIFSILQLQAQRGARIACIVY